MINVEAWYERAKKWPWPHFVVPLLLLVLVDYLRLVLLLVQFGIVAFVALQASFFLLGLFVGIITLTTRKEIEPWKEMLDYRLAKVFPTLTLGHKLFLWLMAKEGVTPPDPVREDSPSKEN